MDKSLSKYLSFNQQNENNESIQIHTVVLRNNGLAYGVMTQLKKKKKKALRMSDHAMYRVTDLLA